MNPKLAWWKLVEMTAPDVAGYFTAVPFSLWTVNTMRLDPAPRFLSGVLVLPLRALLHAKENAKLCRPRAI